MNVVEITTDRYDAVGNAQKIREGQETLRSLGGGILQIWMPGRVAHIQGPIEMPDGVDWKGGPA